MDGEMEHRLMDGGLEAAPPAPAAGDHPIARADVVICNVLGLHLRAAMKFVDQAGAYAADVLVLKDERRVNGKSILEMMTLAADKGTTFTIETSGTDAPEALEALRKLVEAGFGED